MLDSIHTVKFLLAEDDDDHAFLVRRAMKEKRLGSEVAHVHDGEEALAFLRREAPFQDAWRPDVILLDLKMPRVDGHEVLRAVKSDESLKSIPVVVLSTSDGEVDRARAYDAHANSYLTKPVDFEAFSDMVDQLNEYWGVLNRPPV